MQFVSSPYTHDDPNVVERRFRAVARYCSFVMREGDDFLISPIMHWHLGAVQFQLRGEHEYWKEYNSDLLSRCDGVIVLCIPGWEESIGVQWEIGLAKQLGKPVVYIPAEVIDRIEKEVDPYYHLESTELVPKNVISLKQAIKEKQK